MKKINKIVIVYSATRKTDKVLSKVKEIIESSNSEIILSSNVNKFDSQSLKKASKADLILVLGGDGTKLSSPAITQTKV